MQPVNSKDSPLLSKWKDRFGPPRELEISKPIVDEDNFELRRRLLNETSLVSHVLVIRKFGNIGITATQLNLEPGDVVEVLEKYPVGYWRGRHLHNEGIFDADCCVPCRPGAPTDCFSDAGLLFSFFFFLLFVFCSSLTIFDRWRAAGTHSALYSRGSH